jgi:hypothetical protein
MKKLILGLALVLVSLYFAPDAMAARARNTNTGKNSINTAQVIDTKTAKVHNFNLGLVANIDLVGVNTGGNNANKNTGGITGIKTGDGQVTIKTNDKVNDTYVDVLQTDSKGKNSAVNSCTGDGSTNTAQVLTTRTVSVDNDSLGAVVNASLVGVNTGNNSASGNTACCPEENGCDNCGCGSCGGLTGGGTDTNGGAKIVTGDGSVNISHTSTVNTTEVWIEQ